MLRITQNTELKDSLREFKGNNDFELQVSRNNKPLQIYNAYGDGSNIVYFYAHLLDRLNQVDETYELSVDTLLYADGQYYVDSTKYFDNVTPINVLPNGNYYLEFCNDSGEVFESEVFTVYQEEIDGSETYSQPKVKHYENDPIFLFND